MPNQPDPDQPVWASGGVWQIHGDVDNVNVASGNPGKGAVRMSWTIQQRWDPVHLKWQLIRMTMLPKVAASPLRTAPWASEHR
jgi:hypothetical protein